LEDSCTAFVSWWTSVTCCSSVWLLTLAYFSYQQADIYYKLDLMTDIFHDVGAVTDKFAQISVLHAVTIAVLYGLLRIYKLQQLSVVPGMIAVFFMGFYSIRSIREELQNAWIYNLLSSTSTGEESILYAQLFKTSIHLHELNLICVLLMSGILLAMFYKLVQTYHKQLMSGGKFIEHKSAELLVSVALMIIGYEAVKNKLLLRRKSLTE
jgi:hypothetical protein